MCCNPAISSPGSIPHFSSRLRVAKQLFSSVCLRCNLSAWDGWIYSFFFPFISPFCFSVFPNNQDVCSGTNCGWLVEALQVEIIEWFGLFGMIWDRRIKSINALYRMCLFYLFSDVVSIKYINTNSPLTNIQTLTTTFPSNSNQIKHNQISK